MKLSNLHTTFQSDYYQSILQPLAGNCSCGENIEYDSLFITLQSRIEPKMGAEYGNFVEASEPVNWREIEKDCLILLEKSKHIRIIILLMQCRLRQIGLFALEEGLLVLHSLLSDFPNEIYPQIYDEGEFEPFMRANALLELDDHNAFLLDLRACPLPKTNGLQISIKDIEKAFAMPREPDSLSEESAVSIIQSWRNNNEKELKSLNNALVILNEIKKTTKETLADDAPLIPLLTHLLTLFNNDLNPRSMVETPSESKIESDLTFTDLDESESEDLPQLDSTEDAILQNNHEDNTDVDGQKVIYRVKTINSRKDALEKIQEVRSWFQKVEPSSPITLLLDYAEKAAGKNFLELSKFFPAEILAILDTEKNTEKEL